MLSVHFAVTGSGGKLVAAQQNIAVINEFTAIAEAVNHFHPDVRTVFEMGGETSKYLLLGTSPNSQTLSIVDYGTNGDCAAGTGSFLDQQADRMDIGISECSRFKGVEDPPSVAARCAVFAKSDLIHRQQEGYTIPQLWCGLCRRLSFTIANTLLLGEPLRGKPGVIGGVALNNEVVRWLKQVIGQDLFVIEQVVLVLLVPLEDVFHHPVGRWAQHPQHL